MSENNSFGFPYVPYPEQSKLMKAIYECIESSSIGCFESPTGTGKSLSAICASFHWLLLEEKSISDNIASSNAAQATPAQEDDWMAEFYAPKVPTTNAVAVDSNALLSKYNMTLQRIAKSNTQRNKRFDSSSNTISSATDSKFQLNNSIEDTDEFALRHYDSEDEKNQIKARIYGSESEGSDSDNSVPPAASAKNAEKANAKRTQSVMERLHMPQIFYCSRTHSQLAQFVAEMNKTAYVKKDPITGIAPIRCITLGSRKNMCINSAVASLRSESSMSEACLEMQKPSSKLVSAPTVSKSAGTGNKKVKLRSTRAKCEYHSRAAERHLADRALSMVQDIEDVVTLAHDTAACPYYASRRAVQDANVICLPYNMLLNKEMRESLGLNIAGKVIIIDEAHNLIETINQLHSAELSVTQIDAASGAIAAYLRRYQSQLSAKNLYYVNILTAVLSKVRKVLCPKVTKAKAKPTTPVAEDTRADAAVAESKASTASPTEAPASATLTVNDFLFKSGLDGINLFKLKRHIEETNLVQKIGGYAESLAQKELVTACTPPIGGTSTSTSTSSSGSKQATTAAAVGTGVPSVSVRADVVLALRCVLQLVACLTTLEGDGRIFLLNSPSPPSACSAVAPATSATADCNSGTKGAVGGRVDAGISTTTAPTIKFVMLNPSVHFMPLLDEARSVLLLGGTMKPFSYFTSLLFPTVARDRLRFFSCDHVVPARQVGALIVPYYDSPTGSDHGAGANRSIKTPGRRVNFEFTYDKRMNYEQTDALFQTLVEICATTPGGVVVFCTSFQYLEALLFRWRASKILYKLDAIKRVFAESRASGSDTSSTSAGTESVWEAYQRQVQAHPVEGAVLFSVINGKLSEGINFSDELARCVVVVGLPYPDVREPVLQEKMHYVTANDTVDGVSSRGAGPAAGAGGGVGAGVGAITSSASFSVSVGVDSNSRQVGGITAAGRRLCENMCMKAVNQSIGRAIRHIRDYACVVLLDRRYQQDQFRSQLPGWILRNIRVCSGGGSGGGIGQGSADLGGQLKAFFAQQT